MDKKLTEFGEARDPILGWSLLDLDQPPSDGIGFRAKSGKERTSLRDNADSPVLPVRIGFLTLRPGAQNFLETLQRISESLLALGW